MYKCSNSGSFSLPIFIKTEKSCFLVRTFTLTMSFSLQPTLQHSLVTLRPLKTSDFEPLYTVASDPLIWEQHPNKNRYQRDVFATFFKGAMESGGAFCVSDAISGEVIGSTRFYDFNEPHQVITIGYTFLKRSYWGGNYNPVVKKLLLDYAFQFVDRVEFHIGAYNVRSQTAITRLGAKKIREENIAYYGEPVKLNFIYGIHKADWLRKS